MSTWDPKQYLKFANERNQPSLDLISKICLKSAANIMDIGCGPGNSTASLRQHWPEAQIGGLDSSPEMILAAKKNYPQGEWILSDAATFQPQNVYDLIFSNATLQWIPNHETLLPRLFGFVAPGGVLAVQVPANAGSPLATAVASVAVRSAWKEWTIGLKRVHNYRTPEYYFQIISPLGSRFDLWQTTYYHVLPSQYGLIEWYRGTGMKPFLDRLPDDTARAAFESEVLREIEPHYQVQRDGRVLFPFKRTFFTIYK